MKREYVIWKIGREKVISKRLKVKNLNNKTIFSDM
jgi:hypothetical protein